MLTEKDYCDYDTCVALRELGFPRWALPYSILSKKYLLRLYDAQKWLREEKKIHIEIDLLMSKWYPTILSYNRLICVELRGCESYEEALLEGIKEAIKLLKEEK